LVLIGVGVRSLLHKSNNAQTTNSAAISADASKVCTDNARLQAPAYAAGSHQPMALFARSSTAGDGHYQGMYVLGTAPSGTSLHDAYTTVGTNLTKTYSNKDMPVLVGCIARNQETLTGQTCKYGDGKDIPIYTASYHLTVYESRNRRVVKDMDVPTMPTYTCSSFVAYDGKGFYRSWDTAAVATALYTLTQ
jgi:hypothetical protein